MGTVIQALLLRHHSRYHIPTADTKNMASVLRDEPLRLDSTAVAKRSVDMSPSRSSTHSSSTQSRAQTPSSSVPNTPVLLTRPSSPEKRPIHPGKSASFLTKLAAQERLVLELKEKLQDAEVNLGKLKKQWTAHEMAKKRQERRHVEQLQPLETSLVSSTAMRDGESTPNSQGLDRRKSVSTSLRPTQRKVFSGSRHTRTLSLLSPKHSNNEIPFMPSMRKPSNSICEESENSRVPVSLPERFPDSDVYDDSVDAYKGPDKEMILATGKQLVGDFRQGFWTFFEDLRQVTVGEEASSVPDDRGPSTTSGNIQRKAAVKPKFGPEGFHESKDLDSIGSGQRERRQGDGARSNGSGKGLGATLDGPLHGTSAVSIAPKVESIDENEDAWEAWDDTTAPSTRRVDGLQRTDAMVSLSTGDGSPGSGMR